MENSLSINIHTHNIVNIFIYMATSFDPTLGSLADYNIGTWKTCTDLHFFIMHFYIKGGDHQLMLLVYAHFKFLCYGLMMTRV